MKNCLNMVVTYVFLCALVSVSIFIVSTVMVILLAMYGKLLILIGL